MSGTRIRRRRMRKRCLEHMRSLRRPPSKDAIMGGPHGAHGIIASAVAAIGALQAFIQISPQRRNFLRGLTERIDLHHRAAVDHRRGEIDPVVNGGRRHRAVLRQRDRGLGGDARALGGAVNDEDQGFAARLGDVDRGADGAQIMRARPRRRRSSDEDRCGANREAGAREAERSGA